MIKVYSKKKNEKLSEHFSTGEFHCHCNRCKETYIDTDLIDYLEKKRMALGLPINITSGFRCTRHNAECGGKPGSMHLVGKAADIQVEGKKPAQYLHLFEDADGLGLYSKWLHVDVRGHRSRWKG